MGQSCNDCSRNYDLSGTWSNLVRRSHSAQFSVCSDSLSSAVTDGKTSWKPCSHNIPELLWNNNLPNWHVGYGNQFSPPYPAWNLNWVLKNRVWNALCRSESVLSWHYVVTSTYMKLHLSSCWRFIFLKQAGGGNWRRRSDRIMRASPICGALVITNHTHTDSYLLLKYLMKWQNSELSFSNNDVHGDRRTKPSSAPLLRGCVSEISLRTPHDQRTWMKGRPSEPRWSFAR